MSKRKSNIFHFGQSGTISDFLNRFIKRQSNRGNKDYLPYGNDNKLPQEIIALIGNNGTAMRAMRTRSKYIQADGFNASGLLKVNAKQNANQLLAEVASVVAMFQGFCLQVLRKADGTIGEVHFLPLEWVRKSPDGSFVINNSIGTPDEKNEWVKHPAYQGKQITVEQLREIKQRYGNNAEVAYFYQNDAISFDYPIPDWFASEFDVRTGTELMLLDNEMVTNGFMPSAIITFAGNIDDTTVDENGLTAADYRDRVVQGFTGNSRNTDTGKSGRMKVAVFDVATKEEAPIVTTFDIEKIISGSIEKRDDIDRRICRLFGVRPVLMGFEEASILGNQQALANASMQLAMDVTGEQSLIQEAFQDLFDGDFSISTFNPISYIPDQIFADLTSDERRELIGYKKLNNGGTGTNMD